MISRESVPLSSNSPVYCAKYKLPSVIQKLPKCFTKNCIHQCTEGQV